MISIGINSIAILNIHGMGYVWNYQKWIVKFIKKYFLEQKKCIFIRCKKNNVFSYYKMRSKKASYKKHKEKLNKHVIICYTN